MTYKIYENEKTKDLMSRNYNYTFNKETGFFQRWGNVLKEDPIYSPLGPEILDLEISKGACLGGCKFCYKCNSGDSATHHMDLSTFKKVFHKIPKTLTQIAFGITDIYGNPDFFEMMEYSRKNEIIPNYTTHGLDVDEEAAKKTTELCGAVAVSIVNKEKSFDAIKKFTDAGMKFVNIHFMLSMETYTKAIDLIDEVATDPRLKGVYAIVFLHYKPKGRNPESYSPINDTDLYKKLMAYCEMKDISYGFDSCSAPMYFKSISQDTNKEMLSIFAEPCESGLFSAYINCEGVYFPCSFTEGEKGWKEGMSVLDCEDFLKDIWLSNKLTLWKSVLINQTQKCECDWKNMCRSCPVFNITACKGEFNENKTNICK